MKHTLSKSVILPSLSAALLTFGLIGNAQAIAIAESSAFIDWSSLNYFSDNPDMIVDVDFYGPYNYVVSQASNDTTSSGDGFVDNIDTYEPGPLSSAGSVAGAQASASSDEGNLNAAAKAKGTGTAGYSDAYGESYRDVEFFTEGSGTVTFQINYMINAFAASQYFDEEAGAYAEIFAGILDQDGWDIVYDWISTEALAIDENGGEANSREGVLTLSTYVDDPNSFGLGGLFYAGVLSDAYQYSIDSPQQDTVAVPAPSSLLLMLGGLAGFMVRKKRAATRT